MGIGLLCFPIFYFLLFVHAQRDCNKFQLSLLKQALEAGKKLHIKEHTVLDGAGKSITICAPVECKGIVVSDDRWVVPYHVNIFLWEDISSRFRNKRTIST